MGDKYRTASEESASENNLHCAICGALRDDGYSEGLSERVANEYSRRAMMMVRMLADPAPPGESEARIMTALEKLKAAGVEPYTDAEVGALAASLDRSMRPGQPLPGAEEFTVGRLLVTLLEKPAVDRTLVQDALSYAITARLTNQPGWLAGLVDRVNEYLEATGDKSRARADGDGITLRIMEKSDAQE